MAKKERDIQIEVAEVVDYLRMTGGFMPALQSVIQRKITVEAAKKSRIKVTNRELQKAADAFRVVNGLNRASDTRKWLASHGVSQDTLEEFLETNILVDKFKDKLQKKSSKKYLSTQAIKQSVKEMAYQDWLLGVL